MATPPLEASQRRRGALWDEGPQLERHSKNGCMVFRDLGTSCSVHIFAEASVQLRMGCGLRVLNQRGGSEVD